MKHPRETDPYSRKLYRNADLDFEEDDMPWQNRSISFWRLGVLIFIIIFWTAAIWLIFSLFK